MATARSSAPWKGVKNIALGLFEMPDLELIGRGQLR